jgi:hypothetical protein
MESILQKRIWVFSLLAAPLLILVSQFFWENGVLTNTAGWLQVLSYTLWIPAFHGMFYLVRDKMPNYAAIGFLIAIYACIGGNNFGIEGIFNEAFGITNLEAQNELHNKIGIGGVLSLYLPGVLFPLSLIVLGIMLIRTKAVAVWVGILFIIAAVGFPISRMPRIPVLAHIDNILLVASHFLVALRINDRNS